MNEIKQKHLRSLLRHIKLVQDACQLLGERLIEIGHEEFGIILIKNSLSHDQTKLMGIEWDYLVRDEDPEKLALAVRQHWTSNPHHPEYWGNINDMPPIYMAEMVCDCYARSAEFGTDLRGWLKNDATKKFGMSPQGKAYKQIRQYVDLLLDDPLKPIQVKQTAESSASKILKKNGNSNGNSNKNGS